LLVYAVIASTEDLHVDNGMLYS